MNEILFDILKRKVLLGEVKVEDIKNAVYKVAIEAVLTNQ